MRDYSKVSPKFWIGDTGKKLKKAGVEAVVVGMYLMTSPHSNMLGLFYQPELLIAHETGLGFEGASKGLRSCIEVGFCAYDGASEMVWVYEMAKFQIAESLSASDKRSIGVQNEYNALPENPFLGSFFDHYREAFNLTRKREIRPAFEAPSKPHRSQEQEQEQEQEQAQEQTPLSISVQPAAKKIDAVEEIFGYWQQRMDSPQSKLDDKRRRLIKSALNIGYTPAQVCQAIRGCSKSAFHMGQNDKKTRYNGLDLILRNAEKIDSFIAMDIAPPAADNGQLLTPQDRIRLQNEAHMREFLGQESPDDARTIDMEH
jgi:hypothetical protein